MPEELIDAYVRASLARWRATSSEDRPEIRRPGLHGLLGSAGHPEVVLAVTDDRSLACLGDVLSETSGGMIQVFSSAPRSRELVAAHQGWTGSPQTAMIFPDLAQAPVTELPDGFAVSPVRRTEDDPPDGVSLTEAVATVIRAAPEDEPESLAAFLAAARGTTLFAARAPNGSLCATSGFQLTGHHARIILIDTDPDWRRRGLGRAMTAHAMTVARALGATEASLDASALGLSVYERLGFQIVDRTTRFMANSG